MRAALVFFFISLSGAYCSPSPGVTGIDKRGISIEKDNEPTEQPSKIPSIRSTVIPTEKPAHVPSVLPSPLPTLGPTPDPAHVSTPQQPIETPTEWPRPSEPATPNLEPTISPTFRPFTAPTPLAQISLPHSPVRTLNLTISQTPSLSAVIGHPPPRRHSDTRVPIIEQLAVDSTTDLKPRRLSTAQSLQNGGFENTGGWTVINRQVDLMNDGGMSKGLTVAGCLIEDIQDYDSITARRKGSQSNPVSANLQVNYPENDNKVPTSLGTFTAGSTGTLSGGLNPIEAMSYGLQSKSMKVLHGWDVVHGPAVYSDGFSAVKGDKITLDWYANYVSDDFAITAILLDTSAGCVHYPVVVATGSSVTDMIVSTMTKSGSTWSTSSTTSTGFTSGWQRATTTVPETRQANEYRFIFVSGTFDRSGGLVAGALLYIDNISSGKEQTLTMPTLASRPQSSTAFGYYPSSSSGLPVSLSSNTPAVCTVNGNLVTANVVGTCTLRGDQSGGSAVVDGQTVFFAAALSMTASFQVIYVPPTQIPSFVPMPNPSQLPTLTLMPSPLPSTAPTPIPSSNPTISLPPSVNPTPIPTPIPTTFPTVQPTPVPSFNTDDFNFGATVNRASVTFIPIVFCTLVFCNSGATGSKVTSMIQASTLNYARKSTGLKPGFSLNTASDPLSLLFLVQGVATTSKLRSVPHEYRRDFAGNLKIFNLQGIEAPAWAGAAVSGLLSKKTKAWFQDSRRRPFWIRHQTGEKTYECPCSSLSVLSSSSVGSSGSSIESNPSAGSWVYPSDQTSYYFSTTSHFVLPNKFTIETWVKPYSTSSSKTWLSWSTDSKVNCIRVDGSAFSGTGSWHYIVLTWDGIHMHLFIDGVSTTKGIQGNFAECLGYTGRLIFAQDGALSPGKNLGMEQDLVTIYDVAWDTSSISSTRRYVDVNHPNLYALWGDNRGTDFSGNRHVAFVKASTLSTGCTEFVKLEGWAYTWISSSGSWIFPYVQGSFYFSTEKTFTFPLKFTVETWIKPYSTSSAHYWLSFSTNSWLNCISIDGTAFSAAYFWHYVVLTWDGAHMHLYIDGIATTKGIKADFAECLEYTGQLVFGQDGTFSPEKNLGMEQDMVAVYDMAWNASSIFPTRRYVDRNHQNLYALWSEDSGIDATGSSEKSAKIYVSSTGTGITEVLSLVETSEPWETKATFEMRNHFFWFVFAFSVALILHVFGLGLAYCCGYSGQQISFALRFPQVEIKLFIVLSMGMFNTGLAVLCAQSAAAGWKIVAVLQIVLALVFIMCFFMHSKAFVGRATWLPLSNIMCRRSYEQHWNFHNPTASVGCSISQLEVVKMCRDVGMNKAEARNLFDELDIHGTGVLDYVEFVMLFRDNKKVSLSSQRALNKIEKTPSINVPWQKSTPLEAFMALILSPRCEAGKWIPLIRGQDVNDRYGQHFSKFTPKHVNFYSMFVLRNFAIAFILSALAPWGIAQLVVFVVVEFGVFLSFLTNAPFAYLAETRSEVMSFFFRFLAQLVAVFGVFGASSESTTSLLMISAQVLAMLQNVFTQMYPLVAIYLSILIMCIFPSKKLAFQVVDFDPSVFSLSRQHLKLDRVPFAWGAASGYLFYKGTYFKHEVVAKQYAVGITGSSEKALRAAELEVAHLAHLAHPHLVKLFGTSVNAESGSTRGSSSSDVILGNESDGSGALANVDHTGKKKNLKDDDVDLDKLEENNSSFSSLFVVMELCSGGNLADYYRTEEFTQKEFTRVVAELLSALSFLHSHGVAHCDLRPERILLSDSKQKSVRLSGSLSHARISGSSQISDQGDAFDCGDDDTNGSEFAVMGTVLGSIGGESSSSANRRVNNVLSARYMPPELFLSQEEVAAVDMKAVDVFALSMLLWQFWFKQPPHTNKANNQVVAYVLSGQRPTMIPGLGGIAKSYPAPPIPLSGLIEACWAQEPSERLAMSKVASLFESDAGPAVLAFSVDVCTRNNSIAPAVASAKAHTDVSYPMGKQNEIQSGSISDPDFASELSSDTKRFLSQQFRAAQARAVRSKLSGAQMTKKKLDSRCSGVDGIGANLPAVSLGVELSENDLRDAFDLDSIDFSGAVNDNHNELGKLESKKLIMKLKLTMGAKISTNKSLEEAFLLTKVGGTGTVNEEQFIKVFALMERIEIRSLRSIDSSITRLDDSSGDKFFSFGQPPVGLLPLPEEPLSEFEGVRLLANRGIKVAGNTLFLLLLKRDKTLALVAEYRRRLPLEVQSTRNAPEALSAVLIERLPEPAKLSRIFRVAGASAAAMCMDPLVGGCNVKDVKAVVTEQAAAQSACSKDGKSGPPPLPVIWRGPVTTELQLAQASASGCDAVVLSWQLLGPERAADLMEAAPAYGLEVIAEVLDKQESSDLAALCSQLPSAAKVKLVLIGQGLDEESICDLLPKLPAGTVRIAPVPVFYDAHTGDVDQEKLAKSSEQFRKAGFDAIWASEVVCANGAKDIYPVIRAMKVKHRKTIDQLATPDQARKLQTASRSTATSAPLSPLAARKRAAKAAAMEAKDVVVAGQPGSKIELQASTASFTPTQLNKSRNSKSDKVGFPGNRPIGAKRPTLGAVPQKHLTTPDGSTFDMPRGTLL